MNAGFSNYLGIRENNYTTWLDLYNTNFVQDFKDKSMNALGVDALLWSQTSSEETHNSRLWMRSSVIGERLWNSNVTQRGDVMQRLIKMQKTMERRGIFASPVTRQIC